MAKRIVITGSTKGLGRALTAECIRLGHTVAGCGRSAGEIDSLRTAFGPPHLFVEADVCSEDGVRGFAESVIAEQGVPDVLINNAALITRSASLWEVPEEDFAGVMRVNVEGMVRVIRHFLPSMLERGSGLIVNFSSAWGRSTSAKVAPYCASKYAVEGVTKALAQELPAGFAAVPLNPGIIDTDMLRVCFGEAAAGYEQPSVWAKRAAPFILKLGPKENGRSISVP